jgi:IclR family mhp operon transcriptional activator
MGERKLVRGLLRGLDVLRALNERHELTAQQISARTSLPRGTVHRLLDTLVEAGCVAHLPESDAYRLTAGVLALAHLAHGFDDDALLMDVAAPVMGELGRRIVWPTDIATFGRDAMIIRQGTFRSSPLSFFPRTTRARTNRVPILLTSPGRAYIAHVADAERDCILRDIAVSDQPDAALAGDLPQVRSLIAEVRRRGYGFRDGGFLPKSRSIAVPIMAGGRPLACLTVIIRGPQSLDEAAAQYLGPLREAAAAIECALRQSGRDGVPAPAAPTP